MSFSPTSISDLTVWLDAADSNTISQTAGEISTWATKSSFGNANMLQSNTGQYPTYVSNVRNGLPAVRFTTSQNMTSSGNFSLGAAQTVFLSFQPLGGSAFGSPYIQHATPVDTSLGSFLKEYTPIAYIIRSSGQRTIGDAADGFVTPFAVGNWYVTSFVIRNVSSVASNDIYWNINGTTRSAIFIGNSNVISNDSLSGALRLNTSYSPSNHIGEILIYNQALTISEITQVQNYLGLKWGVYEAMIPGIVVIVGNDTVTPLATTSSLTLYKYEPFSYIYRGVGGQSVVLVSASTLIRSFVNQVDSEVHFEAPSGYSGSVSASESIVLRTSPGNVTYTVNVTIGAGRFTVTPSLTAFTFNKNTSVVTTYGSPIVFTSPIPILPPTTIPTLPPGISFVQVDSQNYQLTGTPLTTAPAQSFTVYGFGSLNSAQVVSRIITITIEGEAISLSIDGGSNVTAMNVDMPIGDRTITAVYPLSSAGNLAYTWSNLPDGLFFTDEVGAVQSSPFYPLDNNSTMVLAGIPTLTAAQQFAAAGTSNRTVRVRATRLAPTTLTADLSLNFTFAPTVLFTSTPNVAVYAGDFIDPGQVTITAQTFFDPLNTPISLITAPVLPPGVGLNYTSGSSNAFLTGTATTPAGNTAYTFTADNSNGVTRDTSINIVVSNDVIYFRDASPSNDVCYNFVISRPLAQPLSGRYPSPIQYSAAADSGSPISLSITNLPAGVTANVSGNTLTLTGIPSAIAGLTTSTITATATETGVTISRDMKHIVLADAMVVSPTSGLSFFQNQLVNPRVQFTGTTLSERVISSWTSPNLPAGLSISATGILTGTPLNATSGTATFDLVSSTGFYAQSNTVSYTTIGDNAIVILNPRPATVPVTSGAFSNVAITALSYSAKPVTTFISNIFPVQNPSITLTTNPTSTAISGNLTPAGEVYPKYEFSIYTQVSNSTVAEEKFVAYPNASSTRINYILDVSQTSDYIPATGSTPSTALVFPTGRPTLYKIKRQTTPVNLPSEWNDTTPTLATPLTFAYLSDFGHSKNSIVMVAGADMYRATSIVATDTRDTFTRIDSSTNISSFSDIVGDYSNDPTYGPFTSPGPLLMTIASDGNSNWVALGQGFVSSSGVEKTIVRTSTDDGENWSDISISPPFVTRTSNSYMYYNQGRYFLAQPNSVYRADGSNLSTWTNTGLTISSAGAAMAFSNTKIIVSDKASANSFVSLDNGTTWNGLPGSDAPPAGAYSNVELNQAFGTWVAALTSNTGPPGLFTYSYSNTATAATGSNWASGNTYPGYARSVDFDGSYFSIVHDSNSNRSIFVTDTDMNPLDISPVVTDANIVQPPYTRRVASRLAGVPTVTSITFDSFVGASTTFQLPTKADFTLFQYCGVDIPVQVTPTSNYIYYYASNLPRGLRLALDPTGTSADISGVPSLFTSQSETSTLYARIPSENAGAELPIQFRVILPYVMKKQDGASGYTAWLRHYVNVNGAQNARDSVVFPTQVQPLGQFTAPPAPSVVTDSNCPC
jgi:hypothetical protein